MPKLRLVACMSAFAASSPLLTGCISRQFGDERAPKADSSQKSIVDSGSLNLSSPSIDANCAVVVIGGSTAALAAAVASAREGMQTCLIEPTDWVGGQLTTSGVSAVDFAHHAVDGIDLRGVASSRVNNSDEFMRMLSFITSSNATCWVSGKCYVPADMHKSWAAGLRSTPNLSVFDRTAVVKVETESGINGPQVKSITAIKRTPTADTLAGEWAPLLSEQFESWYSLSKSSVVESARGKVEFTKQVLRFSNRDNTRMLVVVDASEFGDGLVLSGAKYLQSPEQAENDLTIYTVPNRDPSKPPVPQECGQKFVFPFVMSYSLSDGTSEPARVGAPPGQNYSFGAASWEDVWTYRRIKSTDTVGHSPTIGDFSEQNWNPGNDYNGKYLFLSRAQTEASKSSWTSGISKSALEGAEQAALGWYWFMKSKAPGYISNSKLSMRGTAMGTVHGLAKLPYVRDTRRSVGYGGYVLTSAQLINPRAGGAPADRVGIGAYIADHHTMEGCSTPSYMSGQANITTRPFYIPFRALTSETYNNLLVAGKTMAQTYHANSATRLHPIEWSSGTAAGVAAAYMSQTKNGSWGIANSKASEPNSAISAVKTRVQKYQPIDWTGWAGR